MSDSSADPALERIAAVVRACTASLTGPSLICVDLMDVKVALEPERGRTARAVFGTAVAAGPDRARRAAEGALADLRRHLAETGGAEAQAAESVGRRSLTGR